MDRSWISTTVPGDPKYKAGVLEFISFAIKNKGDETRLPCPCYMCHNFLYKRVDEILKHLDKWAFDKTYTRWIWHGEDKEETSFGSFLDNVNGFDNTNEGDRLDEMLRSAQDKFNDNPETFETYTLVNFDKSGHIEDPFILASQAKKVFYMSDPARERWFVVITPKPRYAIDDYDHCDDNIESEARSPIRLVQIDDRSAEDSSIYVRNDHNEGIWIEENRKRRREQR